MTGQDAAQRAAIIKRLEDVPWRCDQHERDREDWESPINPTDCAAGTCEHWKDTPHYGRMAELVVVLIDAAVAEVKENHHCACCARVSQ